MSLETVASVAQAVNDARRRKVTAHVIDDVHDKTSALAATAAALSFPDHFGGNLDALYDMLTDLSWLPGDHVLIWAHPQAIQDWPAIAATLADAVAHNPRLRAQVVQD